MRVYSRASISLSCRSYLFETCCVASRLMLHGVCQTSIESLNCSNNRYAHLHNLFVPMKMLRKETTLQAGTAELQRHEILKCAILKSAMCKINKSHHSASISVTPDSQSSVHWKTLNFFQRITSILDTVTASRVS